MATQVSTWSRAWLIRHICLLFRCSSVRCCGNTITLFGCFLRHTSWSLLTRRHRSIGRTTVVRRSIPVRLGGISRSRSIFRRRRLSSRAVVENSASVPLLFADPLYSLADNAQNNFGHKVSRVSRTVLSDRQPTHLQLTTAIDGPPPVPCCTPSSFIRQSTSTSSVRYLCVHVSSFHSARCPCLYWSRPVQAIMAPLSIQKRSSVQNARPPRWETIANIMSCNRTLHPTPPTTSTSFWLQCAIALSVISTNIAKMVSCIEKHRSATVTSPLLNFSFATVSTNDSSPENETSMPFTTYGSSTSFVPFFASCSTL
mmetsp:Transcript_1447/g.4341  ORF Transcript_1447/g.4341 Transcript_1447/m.4341 type:complete len:313 (+) Transcript_1447:556-1494(+)